MAVFRSLPLPKRTVQSLAPLRSFGGDHARTAIALASVGVLFAIGTVWFEEQGQLDFAVGLILGIALMPWAMTILPSSWKMLPQPGAICAIATGAGTHVALAGLFSGRTIAFGMGGAIVLAALTFWIAASNRD